MKNIYLIPIEPIETRYTCEWFVYLPPLLSRIGTNVISVTGDPIPPTVTKGAFLDFAATNMYKSSQVVKIANMFREGKVLPGDKFLFTDAWHPGVLQVKYMSELLDIPIEIHSMWHAGSYDPQDFLGRLIKDKRWARNVEKAYFHASDYNWFATQFHIDMFKNNVFGADIIWELDDDEIEHKFCQTGWPMGYMESELAPYQNIEKENIILFPHRIAPEKQPEIFNDLKKSLPEYEFIVCQDSSLTKSEYHTLLAKSKMVFSANLQETLGISPFEGAILNSYPYVPDRLSYTEMYPDEYKYPSDWTLNYDLYLANKSCIIVDIKRIMGLETDTTKLKDKLSKNFFTATNLISALHNA